VKVSDVTTVPAINTDRLWKAMECFTNDFWGSNGDHFMGDSLSWLEYLKDDGRPSAKLSIHVI
jgi:hypothetical protein